MGACLLIAVDPALTAMAADDLGAEAEQAIKVLKRADSGLTNFLKG